MSGAEQMVQTLADPQYQETVSNLSPAEQQHMDEQMAGLDTPEAGVAYMRGIVSFKQQHPGVSLTEVDGSFQRPPRSDHPAEQQGGDSGYYGAAAGGVQRASPRAPCASPRPSASHPARWRFQS